jgi:hypothetical protein
MDGGKAASGQRVEETWGLLLYRCVQAREYFTNYFTRRRERFQYVRPPKAVGLPTDSRSRSHLRNNYDDNPQEKRKYKYIYI